MENKVIEFCHQNQLPYEKQNTILDGINAGFIKITTKKLFRKVFDLFFIRTDDFDVVENIVKQLTEDECLRKDYIALFCCTNTDVDEKYCFYFGDNMTQCVYCVYRNDITGNFTYYTDIDTPKLLRNIIKYVVEQ